MRSASIRALLERVAGVSLVALAACGQPPVAVVAPPVPSASTPPKPPPPPPPELVRRPIAFEAIDPARVEVRWEQDLRRASIVLAYDVVVAQEHALCPAPALSTETTVVDPLGCPGVRAFSASCTDAATSRARTAVTVARTITIDVRCTGDVEPYALPATGDVRDALAERSSECFLRHNKFRPQATWTSLYALTQLRIRASSPVVAGDLVGVVARTIPRSPDGASGAPAERSERFCRDDVAYLDGVVPALSTTRDDPPHASAEALAELFERAAPMSMTPVATKSLGVVETPTWSVPLTADAYKSEHVLWEACAAPDVKGQLVVQARCLLLRQVDRVLRDVEDQVRPRTPRGSITTVAPSASPSASATTASSGGPR